MAVHGCDNVLSTLTLWASSASQKMGMAGRQAASELWGEGCRRERGGLLPHGMVEA